MEAELVPYDSLRRVCIRAPNWVGDVVMATPAFRTIRQHLPAAHITLVIRRRAAPLVRCAPWFDETIVYAPEGAKAASEFVRCAGTLRRIHCELGVVLPNSFSSALMFRLSRVRRRVGYARDFRSLLLTDAVPRPSEGGRFKPTYMVDYYLALCEWLGMAAGQRETELLYADADMERADRILRARGLHPGAELFLLHPGSGFGPSKRWPAGRFSRLAELLQERYGAQLAMIAGPKERHAAAEIIDGSRARIADLSSCGIDLHLLKCVVARSSLLVTTDSGPRHYGIALGVPTVCVMGPTHPDYSTSTRDNDHVVRSDVECGPCQRKVCPSDRRCMEQITAEMVVEACHHALSGTAETAGR